jgi:hypothetical protein
MSVGATKRISWKSITLGDYGFITYAYNSNNEVRVIPRAKGVKIRSTKELGGGFLKITVNCFVEKTNRYALESFFNSLDSVFDLNDSGSLVVSDENGTITLTNCYLEGYSQSGEDFRWATFTFDFIKSL